MVFGLGDLLDECAKHFPKEDEEQYGDDVIKFSLIGRPNVGKSSLVNAFLGQDRVIVSESQVQHVMQLILRTHMMDKTMSLSILRGCVKKEKYTNQQKSIPFLRALRAIERSDVVLVVLNADEGIQEQDKKIAGYAHEAGKAIIIVVNKWDAIEKDEKTMNLYTQQIREHSYF